MNTSNYQEVMAELRTEYLESFEDKFVLWRQLFQDAHWDNLELEFHKMKGTGTTYGAPEVSLLCEHLERICRDNKSINKTTLVSAINILSKVRDKYLQNKDFEMESEAEYSQIKAQ